jgi:hypothetical protein
MNTTKKWALILMSILSFGSQTVKADEGMWLPLHIARLNIGDMQKAGCKLTAEQLYSVNSSSLKDAIVSFGGFCTGEIISSEGLILTNHHCGYGAIQSHSSVEKNYLRDGFWAYKKEEELPNPDLFVRFLVRMEDISQRVLSKVNDKMPEMERRKAADAEMQIIKKEATQGTGYDAEVKSFFDGNEYYLMVYETYRDVRLVGTPPESVGKFGGDTDNWMWPRHTGDFSLFRVYMGKDGKPAPYSKDNVPLKPKHFLPVSTSGVKEGDFTMIFGFPGRTNRFLSSYGVKMALDIQNPSIVAIRDKKLKLMKENMDADQAVRIKYASKYAQIANYWKYFIGQSQGLNRLDVVDKKLAEETAFQQWADADPDRKAKYGNVLADMSAVFEKQRKYRKSAVYLQEAALGSETNQLALAFQGLMKALKPEDGSASKPEEVTKQATELKAGLAEHFKDFDVAVDKKLFSAMMKMFKQDVVEDQQPDILRVTLKDKYKGDIDKWTEDVFAKSMFTSQAKVEAFLSKPEAKVLEKDPAYVAAVSFFSNFSKNIQPQTMPLDIELARCNRLYVDGTMQLMKDRKKFYPNANSTMRFTYGKIGAYRPKDAVFYDFKTTLDGIMEKEDPSNDEFVVPAKLKELYQKKDFGRWAENGTVPVGFIGNTDITGGNSGSPVINGNGELVGLAFDGNWEAMSGDIAFEPTFQRTISCDIRYVLFTIDKYANAQNLINEMKLVQTMPEPPAAPAVAPPVLETSPAPAVLPSKPVLAPKTKGQVKRGAAIKG